MGAALGIVGPPEPPAPGSPGPFAFESRNHLAFLLTEAGWADITVEPDDRKLLLGGGLDAACATDFVLGDVGFRQLLGDLDADKKAAVREAVQEALAPHETSDGVALQAGAWLVRAHCRND
jgi:hypothetical protein